MKKWTKVFLTALVLALSMSMTAMAGQWKQDHMGWWYQKDDGSWYANCWEWIDGNGDGVAECYYFTPDGYLVVDGIVDGYAVNTDGAWTENGVVQHKVTVDPSNDAAAVAAYQDAMAKHANLDSMETDTSYLMEIRMQDIRMKIGTNMNLRMSGVKSGNLQYVMDGTMEMFGVTFPTTMFYKDGWYYMDMMDMKLKQPMDIPTAIASMNENTGAVDVNLAMMRNMKISQDGANSILTYGMSDELLNEYAQVALAQTETSAEELSSYTVNSASGSLTVDPNGHIIQEQVYMDMSMTVVDTESGTTSDAQCIVYVGCDYKNPGQTVRVTFPSTDGYTDVTTQ